MSKLLVLDMDGFLVHKKFMASLPETLGDKNDKSSNDDNIIKLKSFDVTVRNHCVDFIEGLLSEYEVAIWTSMLWYNVNEILKHLFGKNFKNKFAFIWNRDHVLLDPDYNKDEISRHDDYENETFPEISKFNTIKDLRLVWQNTKFNRKYTSENTLICDDSLIKMRFNPKINVLLITDFDSDNNDDYLLELPSIIAEKFDEL